MLVHLGVDGKIEILETLNKVKLIAFLQVYMVVGISLLVFVFTMPLKTFFGRERPSRITSVKRICNMRDKEKNKSMPSGDTLACAYFIGMYYHVFNTSPVIFLCLPLVALGRVYVHCHWIGDTIIGGTGGLIAAHYLFGSPYFSTLAKPFIFAIFKL